MAERFTKLQVFPENLYTENAPIIITAGNLLKDNQLSRVLAQLKIKNIDKRTVDEITLQFRLMDANGKILKDAYEHKIEHTGIMENDYYGSKNPITIPDGNVKSCEIKVTQVWFADGTVWNSRSEWVPLAPSTDLDELKAKRDHKLSKEERERQVKELEERRLADAEKAQSKKKFTIIAVALAIVVAILACVVPIASKNIEQNKRIAAEKAEQEVSTGIVQALVGTTWKCTETDVKNGKTFTHEYEYTFVDEKTVERVFVGSDEIYTYKWELNIYDSNDSQSIFLKIILGEESYAYQSEEITYTKSGDAFIVRFVGSSKANGESVVWTKVE